MISASKNDCSFPLCIFCSLQSEYDGSDKLFDLNIYNIDCMGPKHDRLISISAIYIALINMWNVSSEVGFQRQGHIGG